MPSKHIYLVRHGLATLDPSGYGERRMTAGLLPEGAGAIKRIAARLKDVPPSYNVSSPVPRCRETAEIITRVTGKQFVFDDRLTELYQEPFTSFSARVRAFTDELSGRAEEHIVICTHSAVIAGITQFLLGGSFAFQEEYDDPREGELVIVENNTSRTVSFNTTGETG